MLCSNSLSYAVDRAFKYVRTRRALSARFRRVRRWYKRHANRKFRRITKHAWKSGRELPNHYIITSWDID